MPEARETSCRQPRVDLSPRTLYASPPRRFWTSMPATKLLRSLIRSFTRRLVPACVAAPAGPPEHKVRRRPGRRRNHSSADLLAPIMSGSAVARRAKAEVRRRKHDLSAVARRAKAEVRRWKCRRKCSFCRRASIVNSRAQWHGEYPLLPACPDSLGACPDSLGARRPAPKSCFGACPEVVFREVHRTEAGLPD